MAFLKFTGLNFFNSEADRDAPDLEEITKIYDGCGKNKFCIGLPNHCIENKSCKEFAATFKKGKLNTNIFIIQCQN